MNTSSNGVVHDDVPTRDHIRVVIVLLNLIVQFQPFLIFIFRVFDRIIYRSIINYKTKTGYIINGFQEC